MGAVVQSQLNKGAVNFDLSGAGANGNLIYIEFTNSFGQFTRIKHLTFGIFSNITPHANPATTVISHIEVQVFRNKKFNPAQSYTTTMPSEDRMFIGMLTGACFATGVTERSYDFSSGLDIEGVQSGLIVLSAFTEAAASVLAAYLDVLADTLPQELKQTVRGNYPMPRPIVEER